MSIAAVITSILGAIELIVEVTSTVTDAVEQISGLWPSVQDTPDEPDYQYEGAPEYMPRVYPESMIENLLDFVDFDQALQEPASGEVVVPVLATMLWLPEAWQAWLDDGMPDLSPWSPLTQLVLAYAVASILVDPSPMADVGYETVLPIDAHLGDPEQVDAEYVEASTSASTSLFGSSSSRALALAVAAGGLGGWMIWRTR